MANVIRWSLFALTLLSTALLQYVVAFAPLGQGVASVQGIVGRSPNLHRSGAIQSILPRTCQRNPRSRQVFRNIKPSRSIRHPLDCGSPAGSTLSTSAAFGTIELAGLLYDDTSLAFDAWEWTANIGAPAALVAGAVLVTLSETREDLSPRKNDMNWVRTLKRTMRFLLLTSFALEVVSIFVGTMTGSVLLGHGAQAAAKKVGYKAPLQLLYHHHEFEYLTTQICFLQGLFNWLGAVAVELLLPKPAETKSARLMNKCLVGWLFSIILWMLAFYNNHLSFYSDYATMLWRWCLMFVKRFVLHKPFRPMSLLYGPSFTLSLLLTWKAFTSPSEEDED